MTAVTSARPALRHRLAERGIDRTLLLLVPGLLVTACLFLYPFLYGLQLSFAPRQGGIFANYARFFGDEMNSARKGWPSDVCPMFTSFIRLLVLASSS